MIGLLQALAGTQGRWLVRNRIGQGEHGGVDGVLFGDEDFQPGREGEMLGLVGGDGVDGGVIPR
ncbi:MAG: hypothetical protein QM753_02125 [Thermomicrobiales bacterium]